MTDDDRKQSWWGGTRDFIVAKWPPLTHSVVSHRNYRLPRPRLILRRLDRKKRRNACIEASTSCYALSARYKRRNPHEFQKTISICYPFLRSMGPGPGQAPSRVCEDISRSGPQKETRSKAQTPDPTTLLDPRSAHVSSPVILTLEAVFQPGAERPQALPLDILVRVPHELHDALLQP